MAKFKKVVSDGTKPSDGGITKPKHKTKLKSASVKPKQDGKPESDSLVDSILKLGGNKVSD